MEAADAKRFLVISHTHGLFPFAHRLRNEGHEVEVLTWKRRYERSWEGKFTKALLASDKTLTKENLGPAVEAAKAGEITVVTDVRDLSHTFAGAQNYYGQISQADAPVSPLRLGGWFDGETFQAPHVLVVDQGVWPGGLGANEVGGLTLIRADGENREVITGLIAGEVDELKSKDFRGLVQFGIEIDHNGAITILGRSAGWPFLHSHAFLSEMPDLGGLFGGAEPELPKKYTVALPVSLPPWPYLDGQRSDHEGIAPKNVLIEHLTPQQQSSVFWHDVVLDTEAREIRSAGLDGLIGVVHAGAGTHGLARAYAMGVAGRMTFPEKQFRPDVGMDVPSVEANLEKAMGIVL